MHIVGTYTAFLARMLLSVFQSDDCAAVVAVLASVERTAMRSMDVCVAHEGNSNTAALD